jgi:hypothetical protein
VCTVGEVGDTPAQHGVTEKLEALIALFTAGFGTPTAMCKRTPKQFRLTELVAEVGRQPRTVGFGQQRNVRRP